MGFEGDLVSVVRMLGWWFGPPFLVFCVLVFLSPYGRIHRSENTADRKRLLGSLEQDKGATRYRRTVEPVLDWLDRQLSEDDLSAGFSQTRVAFSAGLYLFTATAALGYLVVAAGAQWFLGGSLVFGGEDVVPGGTSSERVILGGLVICYGCILAVSLRANWLNAIFIILVVILLASLLILFSEQLGLRRVVSIPITAGAVIVVQVVLEPVAAVLVPLVLTLTFSISVFLVQLVVPGLPQNFTAGLAATAAWYPMSWWVRKALETYSRVGAIWPLLLTSVAALASLPLAASVGILAFRSPPMDYLYVFMIALPLLNGLADFGSFGLTRFLLRKGLEGNAWFCALKDTVGGLLIFVALGCVTISYFHVLNSFAGDPVFDLAGFFRGLSPETGTPQNYVWILAMLFTTLLPTALHGVIGLYSFVVMWPEPVRRRIYTMLDGARTGQARLAWWGMLLYCGTLTAAFAVVWWAFYVVFSANHGAVLGAVIAFFEGYARMTGAI